MTKKLGSFSKHSIAAGGALEQNVAVPVFLCPTWCHFFSCRPPWWTRPPLSVRTCEAAAVLRITRWCVPRKWIHTFTPGSRPRPQRVSRPHASDTRQKKSSERKPWLTNQNAVLMPRVCVCVCVGSVLLSITQLTGYVVSTILTFSQIRTTGFFF